MAIIKGHLAVAFIVHNNTTLLLKHRKLRLWLPPGGHIDPGEMPHECAIREAKEETGIDIELVETHRNRGGVGPYASPLPLPYHLQRINNPSAERQVFNFVYFAKPKSIPDKLINGDGHDEMRWVCKEEIPQLEGMPGDVKVLAEEAIDFFRQSGNL